ncbi:MAG: HD domain-containing protein [Acidimicrobiia bacterium]|nr:HD domain-containing protein [Acidimicrobiia bacterium]
MSTGHDRVRSAELIASLCLASDLGMGFPFEHGLQSTLTTMRLCEALGVDDDTASRTYYACLLMYSGCTVDGEEKAGIFESGLTRHNQHRQHGSTLENLTGLLGALPSPATPRPLRAFQAATRLPRAFRFLPGHFAALCEVAGMLSERFGLSESISGMFPFLTERWDGSSFLKRASGEDIPLPIRIIHVGRDATYQRLIGDDEYVLKVISERAGGDFDPDIVDVFLSDASELLGPPAPPGTVWDEVLAAEPSPTLTLTGAAIDRALGAIGIFSELGSPYLAGHCLGLAALAAAAAEIHGFSPSEVETIRRAALVHDVGRAAVSPRVWGRPGPLTADEREQVRLHPYHTERVLARSTYLIELAPIATAHHERLDGSGYYRGVTAASLSPSARLLAAADAFHSKTEPRPYRDALSSEEATDVLVGRAKQGHFDADMVVAIAKAAGEPAPAIERPAGLTEREVQVVGLLARGLRNKQIARELDISTKTADRHIQNSYRKIGVSSRAAATLFATEHGLVPR